MNIFNKIFGKRNTGNATHHTDFKVNSLEDFISLSAENRILTLIKFGDRQPIDHNHFSFFKHAILVDLNRNVQFAALKRIHVFKDHPDTMPMMTSLMNENHPGLEPYFSMALSRLGLISLEELEKKINSSK